MAYCKNCGTKLDDGAKFCPECGAEIKDNGTKFCAKCGNERKGTEKFCSQCGTPFGQSLIVNDKEIKGQGKSAKKGVVIASIVAVIALGGAAWYFLGNQQDKYSLEGLAKAAVNYDYIDDFHDGMAMVTKGEKIGFIDRMGNEVIPCIYDFMEDTDCSFNEGFAYVRQGEKCFFIDKDGNKPFEFKYDYANHFSEGLAMVWKDGKCGYIDTKGNEVIQLTDKYDYGGDFSEGMAAVSKDDKVGFIDKNGNKVIPLSYDLEEGDDPLDGYIFSEGFSAVQKDGKYGFIDKNGNEVIPCKYSAAFNFSEGMAVVSQNEKFGYIDRSGTIIIPCEYDYAYSFSEGLAVVSKDSKNYLLGHDGSVVSCKYDNINSFNNGLARVSNNASDYNSLSGFIDKNGKEVIPCIYNTYSSFSEGLAVVQKDGLFGFIDKKGNSTFDIQNDEVKKMVNAKIREKEQKRKQEEEEEKRAEEVRRRLEEENQPQTKLFNIAQSGNFVWVNHWEYHDEVLYFYPIDKYSGMVSFVHYEDNFKVYSKALSFKTNYTVSSNQILFSFTKEHWSGIIAVNFKGIIQNDGGTVRIIRDNETNDKIKQHYVTRLRSDIGKDPL